MISKTTAKFIKSLQLKKYRKEEQSFLVEGKKSVQEVLRSDFEVTMLIVTNDFIKDSIIPKDIYTIEVSEKELEKVGALKSNNQALAVVKMKVQESFIINPAEYVIALEDINDPGNLGTIIRIADWYGISKVLASPNTADFYNPKVISASKGSFTRVDIWYMELDEILSKAGVPVYGAMLSGENVHQVKFSEGGVLLMGNEAHGISEEMEKMVSSKITIPAYGGAESLNVAMATAIICDNVKRSLAAPL
ncbi:TrmH family RNA methyltransferase [Fulvivirga sediminis]|uniref:RNA methyltransferase n=1 Tax=Fulvivirga sediminis TaxID=2803949 RepID=A0A937FB16_9BACT|nr:RNA methyltransferase [Fulvivirga sediminis]MBL3658651.1 RNA methyltransferase [Fulvivirga sediminis]